MTFPSRRSTISLITPSACVEQLENTRVQLENAKAEVQKPFPQEEELKTKLARLNELNALLNQCRPLRWHHASRRYQRRN